MRGCGSVSPFVDLLCDRSAAQRAALLPVKPESDALVTEYVLHDRKSSRQLAMRQEEYAHINASVAYDDAHVCGFT